MPKTASSVPVYEPQIKPGRKLPIKAVHNLILIGDLADRLPIEQSGGEEQPDSWPERVLAIGDSRTIRMFTFNGKRLVEQGTVGRYDLFNHPDDGLILRVDGRESADFGFIPEATNP